MAYDVSTVEANNIQSGSLLSGAFNVDTSGGTVLSKGLVYKIGAGDPSIETDGIEYFYGDDGDFTLGIYTLDPSTSYSLRAFYLFSDPSLLVYGNTVTADTLAEELLYTLSGPCLSCDHLARDTSGNVLTLPDGRFYCNAFFPGDSTPEYIPDYFADGSILHDTSIAGQNGDFVWTPWDETAFLVEQLKPYLDDIYFHEIYTGSGDGYQVAGGWTATDPSSEYYNAGLQLQVAKISAGDNVTLDVSYGPGDLYPESITINATGSLGVTKTYVDGSLGLRDVSIANLATHNTAQDVSIAWLNSYRVIQDASIAAMSPSSDPSTLDFSWKPADTDLIYPLTADDAGPNKLIGLESGMMYVELADGNTFAVGTVFNIYNFDTGVDLSTGVTLVMPEGYDGSIGFKTNGRITLVKTTSSLWILYGDIRSPWY